MSSLPYSEPFPSTEGMGPCPRMFLQLPRNHKPNTDSREGLFKSRGVLSWLQSTISLLDGTKSYTLVL